MNNIFDAEKTITLFDIDEYFLNDRVLEEMNLYLSENNIEARFDYPHIGGGAQDLYHEVIVIGLTFAQGVGVNALYDILKYVYSVITQKIKFHKNQKPALYIELCDKHIKLDYGFDLTDTQKDEIVHNSIEMLKDLSNKPRDY